MLTGLWHALTFLTTLPAPAAPFAAHSMARAARWFPAVGLVIGVVLAAASWSLAQLWPPLVGGVLLTIGWAGLTGLLHLDGLADCCDGLLPPLARARRLEIMRDPRLGAFGVTGLTLALLLKVGLVASLIENWPALLLAPVWARWLILPAARLPLARPGGMGASFASGMSRWDLLPALVLPLLLTAVTGLSQWLVWPAAAAAAAAAWFVTRLAIARLGGVTGDVFGALIELSELAFLLVMAIS